MNPQTFRLLKYLAILIALLLFVKRITEMEQQKRFGEKGQAKNEVQQDNTSAPPPHNDHPRSRPCYDGILERRDYALKRANGIRDNNDIVVIAELNALCESVLKYDPCVKCSGECTEQEQEEHKAINDDFNSRVKLYRSRLNTKKELIEDAASRAAESYRSGWYK